LELLIDRVVVTGEVVEIRYAIPVAPEGEREPFCRLRTDYQVGVPGTWDK
jgi:site-specific DNA recombinase